MTGGVPALGGPPETDRKPGWQLCCDGCLRVVHAPPMMPWPDVWRRAERAGWRGSVRPHGWHRCPTCADCR